MRVDDRTVGAILDVYDKALGDEEYRKLHEEYAAVSKGVLDLYGQLTREQLEVLTEYLGVCGAMHLRLMALACSNGPKGS